MYKMTKIKILQVHEYYIQPGGEDTIFESEVALLQQHGHPVVSYFERNTRTAAMPRASLALQTVWSWESYHKLLDVLQQEKPDVAHFHNTFPLISPSAYYACRKAGVPVIQSLHNPRLICPVSTLYRNGKTCTDCLGKTPPYPSVLHGCYHHSRAQTSVIATLLTTHRLIGTWKKLVDNYTVATDFFRRMFIRAGLPEKKIYYKPLFVVPAIPPRDSHTAGDYALYVGRLAPEKGIHTLLAAWQKTQIPLKIRGSGDLESQVRKLIDQSQSENIEIIGRLSKVELDRLISRARFLIWPSEGYYETFGFVAVESYSLGVPVIGSRTGVNAEIVRDGITGLHFTAGDPEDLANKMRWAWEHTEEMIKQGQNARDEYEAKYTAAKNYDMLLNLYEGTIANYRN